MDFFIQSLNGWTTAWAIFWASVPSMKKMFGFFEPCILKSACEFWTDFYVFDVKLWSHFAKSVL